LPRSGHATLDRKAPIAPTDAARIADVDRFGAIEETGHIVERQSFATRSKMKRCARKPASRKHPLRVGLAGRFVFHEFVRGPPEMI